MKYVLGLVVAITVLGVVQASSEDDGCVVGVTSGTGVTVGLSRNNYPGWGPEHDRDQRGRIRIAGDDCGYREEPRRPRADGCH
jgi:hypothetical protein